VSFLFSVTPNNPGLASAVSPKIKLSAGIQHIYDMNYLWGFTSKFFPVTATILDGCIYEDSGMYEGVEVVNDGAQHTYETKGTLEESSSAKSKSI
jgi:nucleobase:cation symporter-1, NCS1 family